MTRPKIYYHFTNSTLRDGSPIPAVGEWLTIEGGIKPCERGFQSLEVRSYMALSEAGRDAISLMIRAKLQLESAYDAAIAPAFVSLRAVTVCNQ